MESQHFLGYPVKIRREAFRRRLTMSVRPNSEIQVICSQSVSDARIVQFLMDNVDWIKKSQARFAKIRATHPAIQFLHGEQLPFRGEKHKLCLVRGDLPKAYATQVGREIWVSGDPALRKKSVRAFYQREGILALQKSVGEFAKKMNLYPTSVSYRCQKSRWGSCSSQGGVSLNWRLVAMPPSTLDYVVVHELAHLKYRNHSHEFWQLVESYAPDFRKENQRLRDLQYDVDFLCAKSELHL